MERLTGRWPCGLANYPANNLPDVINRLAKIEDILGDTYDLDRLRELVDADKEANCHLLPCKVGDIVYFAAISPKEIYKLKVTALVSQKDGDWTIMAHTFEKNSACLGFSFSISDFEKFVFKSFEAAAASYAKENENGED